MKNMRFFATAAKGTESLVAQELAAIGGPEYPIYCRRCPFRGRTGDALPGEPVAPHREQGVDANSRVRLPDTGSTLRKCPQGPVARLDDG